MEIKDSAFVSGVRRELTYLDITPSTTIRGESRGHA